jgi:hypothetical protein
LCEVKRDKIVAVLVKIRTNRASTIVAAVPPSLAELQSCLFAIVRPGQEYHHTLRPYFMFDGGVGSASRSTVQRTRRSVVGGRLDGLQLEVDQRIMANVHGRSSFPEDFPLCREGQRGSWTAIVAHQFLSTVTYRCR